MSSNELEQKAKELMAQAEWLLSDEYLAESSNVSADITHGALLLSRAGILTNFACIAAIRELTEVVRKNRG